jgi:hypothetical protein
VSAKGAEISITFEIETMLLDPHVTHAEPVRQFSDGQPLAPFEEINYRKPLAAANLRNKSLHGHQVVLATQFQIGEVFNEKTLQKNAPKIVRGFLSAHDAG